MVIAFVDDSGSGGDSTFSILAGYSASDITWNSFWPDWKGLLDLDPKIEYFKMSEAESLKGQFLGFFPEERTNRVNQFIEVILTHDLQEASVAIPMKDYREIVYPVLHRNRSQQIGGWSPMLYKLAMIASRGTPLCWATLRRIEPNVPSRKRSWSGIEIRC
jgi:hypothetical protein